MDQDIITSLDETKIIEYDCLTERAKQFYDRQCQQYIDDGELRIAFLPKLAIWAESYDRYWTLRAAIEKEGYITEEENRYGNTVKSPNGKVRMMNDALRVANDIIAEFGGSIKQARKIGKEKATTNPLDEWNKKYNA